MPFYLFRINRSNKKAVAEANKYFFIGGCVALFVSFILNLFVIAVYANTFYETTNQQAYNICSTAGSIYTEDFFSGP